MRVLQVHTRYREAGGEDTVVSAEAGLLRRAGHEVVAYEAANPGGSGAAAAALAAAPHNPLAARRVSAAADEARPDVAHVHNTWFALSPAVISGLRRRGVPVVMTLHNYRLTCANSLLFRDGRPCEDCVGTHPWRGVLHRCYRGSATASAVAATTIAANRAASRWDDVALFLAPSAFARERIAAGGVDEEQIVVSPLFADDPGAREAPPSASRRVVYVGRLASEKGLPTLLSAWEQARPAGLTLDLVGTGPLETELLSSCPPGVRLLGHRPNEEVRRLMRASRASVVPSEFYEVGAMGLIESLAAGLPVIASGHGAPAELLEGFPPRWRPNPGAVGEWAEALADLTGDARVDELGRRARQRYEQHHTPEAALGRLEHAYRRARAADGGGLT